MITLTENAAEEIKRIIAEKALPADTCLRVGVRTGGCSGFAYMMDFAPRPANDDETFESHGLRIVCDPKSHLYLDGTVIDFSRQLTGGGFVFNNPNARGKCSCGASFSV